MRQQNVCKQQPAIVTRNMKNTSNS